MGNQVIYRQTAAEELHQIGLSQETGGYLVNAHSTFARALDSLGDTGEDYGNPLTQALSVQRARIERDLGFTFVRAAVSDTPLPEAETRTEAFRVAGSHLIAARLITGRFVDAPGLFKPRTMRGSKRGDILGELHAEHGATIGLLARMGTAEQATQEEIDYNAVALAGRRYDVAHFILSFGNYGYYRVSNAMNAARHARIHARSASGWVATAEAGLVWTATHDPAHLKDAARTNASRMRFLLTRSRAIESVRTAP